LKNWWWLTFFGPPCSSECDVGLIQHEVHAVDNFATQAKV